MIRLPKSQIFFLQKLETESIYGPKWPKIDWELPKPLDTPTYFFLIRVHMSHTSEYHFLSISFFFISDKISWKFKHISGGCLLFNSQRKLPSAIDILRHTIHTASATYCLLSKSLLKLYIGITGYGKTNE